MQLLYNNWKLSGDNLNTPIDFDLPADTFSILQDAKIIKDPYDGMNEYDVAWVGEQDWHFHCAFSPNADILAKKYQWLNITSLDTRANITLNNEEIAQVCNMHTNHIIDVTGKLSDHNQLDITLKDNVKEAKRRADELLPFEIPYSGGHNNQVPHMNLLRKPHCHAGWDWGIMLLVSGIYGDVSLQSDDHALLKGVTTKQYHNGGKVTLTTYFHFDVFEDGQREIIYRFDGKDYTLMAELHQGRQIISSEIIIDNPKLWWPAGEGKQPLYDLNVIFGNQQLSQKIGLRKIGIIRKKDDIGLSFTVRVNDRDIFCKGANWIPMDAKPSSHTYERYERLIVDAKAANMNMLRIWGGGQYENDPFYEICDREGILIWHDLMFACSLYPSMDWYLNEVSDELDYQLIRLQHHACIALWCGDNEVIGAINWYEISRNNRDTYLVNYDRLNNFCGQMVKKLDQDRIFWPSSPCAGDLDFGDAFHDPSSGDMHYWEVWHEGKSFDAFQNIQPRFCSEFGFQSLPSLPEVEAFCPKEHRNMSAPTMESHQKNNRGNSIIAEMFSRYFRVPKDFEQQLWLSQLQQALAIQTAVDFWRSSRPICMGTLYWQLNDNWPVASWSSIQHSGRWRLLHYFAKRFYQPSVVNLITTTDHIYLNAIHDHVQTCHMKAELTFRDFTGNIVQSWDFEKDFNMAGAEQLLALQISCLREIKHQGFFWLKYDIDQTTYTQAGFAVRPKALELPEANISYAVREKDGIKGIEITSDAPVFYVSLELAHALRPFGDNGFSLLPDAAYWVSLPEDTDMDLLEQELRIYHLSASYIWQNR